MKLISKLLLIFTLAGCFISCDNELKTNAPEKEIMVVYGILNSADSFQYIRVSKAYLVDNGSAVVGAQDPNNIYYDSLSVTLTDDLGNIYNGEKDAQIAKDSGYFTTQNHILYKVNLRPNSSRKYKIKVTNPKSGLTAEAETFVVGEAQINAPAAIVNQLDFDSARFFSITFTTGQFCRVNDATLRFYYEEFDQNTNQSLGLQYVDWTFINNQETQNIEPGNVVAFRRTGNTFLDFLGNNIPVKSGVYRQARYAEIYVWSGDSELFTYISVNQPSIGVVQKKPEYTNISGGNYGLFASRHLALRQNISFSPRTLDNLETYRSTQKLNFRH